MDCNIKKVSNDMVAANHGQVWTTTSKVKHSQNPSIASPCAWLHMKCITYVCLHIIIMCMSHFLGIWGPFLHEPQCASWSFLHEPQYASWPFLHEPKIAFVMYVLRIASCRRLYNILPQHYELFNIHKSCMA